MSKDFDNTNRGVLFREEEKKNPNGPDYKGRINAGGVDHWLSAWIKTGKDGRKFMSLSVTVMEERPNAKPASKRGGAGASGDDIPFAPIGKGIAGHAV